MINIERFHKYIELLEGRRFITAEECERILEISHATFKRDLAALRDRFDVPILYDRDVGAYKLDQSFNRNRLPGIWFSQQEIDILRAICNELLIRVGSDIKDEYRILESKFSRIASLND